MRPYADTNFFTRTYLELPESAAADDLLRQAQAGGSAPIPVTWLHRAEFTNAISFSVWLSKQGGHPMVSEQQASVALATFREDLHVASFLRSALPDMIVLEKYFEETSRRHTPSHGFRTYDILHVVSARVLGCDTFFSFDQRAKKLAAMEGLRVPN